MYDNIYFTSFENMHDWHYPKEYVNSMRTTNIYSQILYHPIFICENPTNNILGEIYFINRNDGYNRADAIIKSDKINKIYHEKIIKSAISKYGCNFSFKIFYDNQLIFNPPPVKRF